MARDPSLPLIGKQEAYAFARACGYSMTESTRRAGGNPDNGIGTKWEAKPSVQARIKHLRSLYQSDEMLAARRERIRERLELSAFGSIFEFAFIDEDGSPQIDWQKVKNSPMGVIVSEFSFDKDTGKLVRFKREDAENALAQLRDMHGFKSVNKTALTDPSGQQAAQPFVVEIVKFGDAPTRAPAA